MANDPNLLTRVYDAKDAAELKDAATEYYNVQLDIEKSMARQNTTLLSMLGLNKELSVDIVQVVKRTNELHKNIQKDLQLEEKLRLKHSVTADETMRRELQQSMASAAQRRAAQTAELQLLETIAKRGLLPILFLFGKIFAVFKSMDKAAWEFRKAMGMTRDSASALRDMAQKVAIEFTSVGVTIDGAYKSIQSLGQEMGGVHNVSKDLVKTLSLLQAQLGVSTEDSAGFMRNMAAVSGSTMEAQQNMAYIAANLSAAGGVPLPAIMKDVAKMSSTTLAMVSRVPNQIVRAAIEARRLNTTLGDMAKSSAEILNFTDNINAEMEASVLLGRSINLQKARELAYHRDLEGSTKEILRVAKQVDFENLDYFQMNAFAKSTGRSVEELTKMIQADKQLQLARTSADPKIRAQYEMYEKMRLSNEATLKAEGKNLELQMMKKANQERLTAITQKWNEIWMQISGPLLKVVDIALSIVPPLIDAGKYVAFWAGSLYGVAKIFEGVGLNLAIWTEKSAKVSGFFLKMAGFGNSLLTPFIKIGAFLGKMGPLVGAVMKMASPFLKLLGPVGWLVTAVQAIYGAITGWNSATGSFGDKLKGAVMGVLRAIIPGFDWIAEKVKWLWQYIGPVATFLWKWFTPIGLIVQASKGLMMLWEKFGHYVKAGFAIAWAAIKPFLGQSPSQIGLLMVQGLVSVGAMMFDALTSPWRRALAWIFDKIPGMGSVADKLRGGLTDILNKPVETKAAAAYVPAVTVTPKGTALAGTSPTTEVSETPTSKDTTIAELLAANKEMVTAINGLRADLNAGKIGINMDGQLLSATTARQTEFRGGYGVNKA